MSTTITKADSSLAITRFSMSTSTVLTARRPKETSDTHGEKSGTTSKATATLSETKTFEPAIATPSTDEISSTPSNNLASTLSKIGEVEPPKPTSLIPSFATSEYVSQPAGSAHDPTIPVEHSKNDPLPASAMVSESHPNGLQFSSEDETEPVSSGGKPVVPQGSSSNIEVAPSTTSTLPVTPKPTAATSAAAKAPAGCVTGGAAPAETTQSSLSSEHKMSATGLQSHESKVPNSLAPLEENDTSGKVI